MSSVYIGRFAPSPTGPLHLGSLFTAVASFLDAHSQRGKWLLRIDDIDTPRIVKNADTLIKRDLERFGLLWDDETVSQSRQTQLYTRAFTRLKNDNVCYPCYCSRKSLFNHNVYPGTCRDHRVSDQAHAYRLITTNQPIQFEDQLQGKIISRLERDVGDFIILRKDTIYAYQLAVVVDDFEQHVTHVVRGYDLLDSTPRQIYLQQLLGYPVPNYMHLPVLVNASGDKLSKQTLAPAIGQWPIEKTLCTILSLLKQAPPSELVHCDKHTILDWAIAHWNPTRLEKLTTITL